MKAPEESSYTDIGSRRNWTICWRWSASILAMEFVLVLALIGFAMNSRSDSRVKALSQAEQAQQQRPAHSRKACPLVDLRKTQDL